jgi:CheY-like chemotaxis protein
MVFVRVGLAVSGPGYKSGANPVAHILVIDDQPDIREVLKTILEQAGHEVRLAAEGGEGLRLCAQSPAEIVITDLHMPGMNGLETVHALREQLPAVKIIAMSGADLYMADKNLESSVINGADRTLLKPFRVQDVLSVVEALAS